MSIVSIWKSFLSAIGSYSADISSVDAADNPLPPCPDSPNCIRITKIVGTPIASAFDVSVEVIKALKPEEVTASKSDFKIKTVFKVFSFRDDMTVQLSERDSTSSYLHIRSSSRVGFSDLGVNRRRVKKFWKRLQERL